MASQDKKRSSLTRLFRLPSFLHQRSKDRQVGNLCENCADMDIATGLRDYCGMFNNAPFPCLKDSPSRNVEHFVRRKSDSSANWAFLDQGKLSNRCDCCAKIKLAMSTTLLDCEETNMAAINVRWKSGLFQLVRDDEYGFCDLAVTTTPGFHSQFLDHLCKVSIRQATVDMSSAKTCFESCYSTHESCKGSKSLGSNTVHNLHLIDCSTEKVVAAPDGARFAALSYVWGRQSSSTSAPFAMPQTIRDAISVTEGLGLNYLWADAYCVNQNDSSDLHQQIIQMDRIYSRADVTIIAVASKSASEGLAGVSIKRARGEPELVIDGICLTEYTHASWCQIPDTLWASRGWTFQESLHSRRRLFFTQDELLFDCLSGWECEHAPERPREHGKLPAQDTIIGKAPADDYDGAPLYWRSDGDEERIYDLIKDFSLRNLTFPADVLKAFAGMRNNFQSLTPPVYHHWGVPMLYRNSTYLYSFIQGLCWFHHETIYAGLPKPRRPGDFPSWSWVGWEVPGHCVSFHDYGSSWTTTDVVIDVELGCGTLITWENFESKLQSNTQEEHGTSKYLMLTGRTTLISTRKTAQGAFEFSLGVGKRQIWQRLYLPNLLSSPSRVCGWLGIILHSSSNTISTIKPRPNESFEERFFCILVLINQGDHYKRVDVYSQWHRISEISSCLDSFQTRTVRIG